jgi:alkyl sulfatase BDS1-like metallo-beta-lactamase superfamily hydrolase
MSNVLKSKRFVVRKSLVGKNVVIEFTNKKGDTYKYNHDKAFAIMKDTLEKLPCFEKYKSYTATNSEYTSKLVVGSIPTGVLVQTKYDTSRIIKI